jgi:hypothetical protein
MSAEDWAQVFVETCCEAGWSEDRALLVLERNKWKYNYDTDDPEEAAEEEMNSHR